MKLNYYALIGITPAPAGSTGTHRFCLSQSRDHPRACGEHFNAQRFLLGGRGSPPRLRGALQHMEEILTRLRITPAPAGSTGSRRRLVPAVQDHPRACGEHSRRLSRKYILLGSPPRLRGALTA